MLVPRYYNGTINYYNFFMGNTKSECNIPCTQTRVSNIIKFENFKFKDSLKISSRLIEKRKLKSANIIKLDLDPLVDTTESYFPDFSLSGFLADCGGSLGLWMGLGAVQLISNAADLLAMMKSNNKNYKHNIKIVNNK